MAQERKKSLITNAVLNSIKTIISMLFPLITFPYASRILQVENLGKVNFSSSIVSYFALLAGLGIRTYAIREGARVRNNKTDLEKFASEMFTINILSTIISYICLVLVVVGIDKLHSYSLLITVQSFTLIGTTIGVEWLYSIYEDYLYITIRSIAVHLLSMVLLFTLVHKESDYVIYAAITTFSATAAYIFNFLHSKKYLTISFTKKLNLKKHLSPILIIFAMSVATTIYVNSDTTMLGFMVGDYSVGIYNAATKMYNILKNLMAASILVALPRLSNELANNDFHNYRKESSQILNTFMMILLPSVIGLFMVAKEVILLLAGESYIEATGSLRVLCLSLIFSIFAVYYTNVVLLPFKKEKQVMYGTIVSAIVNIALNLFMIPTNKHLGAAITTAIAELTVLIWQIIAGKGIKHGNVVTRDLLLCFLGCGIIIGICSVLSLLQASYYFLLVLKIAISVVAYFLILLVGKHSMVGRVIGMIKDKIVR